jgi:energy-coupling factor transporter ATP-binding protein EcfA2
VQSNPFSTRFIRPGAISFLFPAGESVEGFLDRLRAANWWGQIVGPHGSGKSTLLAALLPALEAAGRRVVPITLHQGEHRLPRLDQKGFSATTQVVIDGYEQLSWWSRRRLKSVCRRHGAGLLVTAHSDIGLPALYETKPTEDLAHLVVARLTAKNGEPITPDDVRAAYAAARGDIRETLFKLYDVYQNRNNEYR